MMGFSTRWNILARVRKADVEGCEDFKDNANRRVVPRQVALNPGAGFGRKAHEQLSNSATWPLRLSELPAAGAAADEPIRDHIPGGPAMRGQFAAGGSEAGLHLPVETS
jgi:hypothetical protein